MKDQPGSNERPAPAPHVGHGVWCKSGKDRIDLSVCITRSTRRPEKCSGCPLNH